MKETLASALKLQKKHLRLWLLLIAFAFTGRGNLCWSQEVPKFDHHVHVLSRDLIRHWKSTGMPFSRPDEAYCDIETILTSASVECAFLLSMAHLYSTGQFLEIPEVSEKEVALVQAENDFVAKCALQRPGKLVGFYSVNPLRPYAREEMERCRQLPGLGGLKLHLPACDIELSNEEHVKRLVEVFAWCEEHRQSVVVHAFYDSETDPALVTRFWRDVVGPHPGIELYIAHLGVSGGYNATSRAMLDGFRTLVSNNSRFEEPKIWFDLSGAVIPEGFEEAEPTSDESCKQLGEQMRVVGLERFVFASDYPVFSPAATARSLTERLGLSLEEVEILFNNRSSRFEADR